MVFTALLALATNIVFVGVAMALDTVSEVTNPLLDVLAPNLFGVMLVAAVTAIATVIIALMTSGAGGLMVTVEQEIPVVVVGRGSPPFLAMALGAVAGDVPMDRVLRCAVAGLTLTTRGDPQQVMVESSRVVIALHPGVIAMAGHAVILDELLVEGGRGQGFGDGLRCRGQAADIRGLVTGDAALGGGPVKGA